MRAACERHFSPEVKVIYAEGGMLIWVELPEGLDAGELLVKARDLRVIFAPARYFYFHNPKHNAFRLCFTALPEAQIEKGISILGELLKTEIRKCGAKKESLMGANVALV